MPTQSTTLQLAPFVLVATITLALLVRGRVFTRAAFVKSPDRSIGLGLSDLIAGLGLTIMGMLGFSALAAPLGLVSDDPSPQRKIAAVMVSQVCVHALPLLYFIARAGMAPNGLTKVGLLPTKPTRDLLAGVGGFICVLPIVIGVMMAANTISTLLGHPPEPLAHTLLPLLSDPRSDAQVKILLVISAAVFAPVFEECLYRGLLQSTLVEAFRGWRWPAVLIASAVFTVIHLGGVEPQALPGLFVLAIGFGWLYERTGSLWPSILLHALFNGFNLAMATLLVPVSAPA